MKGDVDAVKAVRKAIVTAVLVLLALAPAYSVSHAALLGPLRTLDTEKIRKMGMDIDSEGRERMLWYVVDYGARNGVPFAVVHSYYSNEEIRQAMITNLINAGVDPDAAYSLFYTEHGYEFSQDGSQFIHAYIAHGVRNSGATHIHVSYPERVWHPVANSFGARNAAEILFQRR